MQDRIRLLGRRHRRDGRAAGLIGDLDRPLGQTLHEVQPAAETIPGLRDRIFDPLGPHRQPLLGYRRSGGRHQQGDVGPGGHFGPHPRVRMSFHPSSVSHPPRGPHLRRLAARSTLPQGDDGHRLVTNPSPSPLEGALRAADVHPSPRGRHDRVRLHGPRPLPRLAHRRRGLRRARRGAARDRGTRRVGGRRGRGAAGLGGARHRLAGGDLPRRHRHRGHRHPRFPPRRDRDRRARGRQARAVRETAGQQHRRGGSDGPGRGGRHRPRPDRSARLHLPPGARARPGPAVRRNRQAGHHPAGEGGLPPGLAGRRRGTDELAAAAGDHAAPARSAISDPMRSTRSSTSPASRPPQCAGGWRPWCRSVPATTASRR